MWPGSAASWMWTTSWKGLSAAPKSKLQSMYRSFIPATSHTCLPGGTGGAARLFPPAANHRAGYRRAHPMPWANPAESKSQGSRRKISRHTTSTSRADTKCGSGHRRVRPKRSSISKPPWPAILGLPWHVTASPIFTGTLECGASSRLMKWSRFGGSMDCGPSNSTPRWPNRGLTSLIIPRRPVTKTPTPTTGWRPKGTWRTRET